MHYIDAADNLAGQFQGGNANIGLKGTVVDASWLNAVQDEICNVITKSGYVLDKSSNTQLESAIGYKLPRIKHKRIIDSFISNGSVSISQQTKILDFKQVLGVTDCEQLVNKFIDVRACFEITSETAVLNSYFAADVFINKRNGQYQSVAWYSVDSTSKNFLSCRWCFVVPDGLVDDDPVSLYVYSRTEGTSTNPTIGVKYNGCYSVDPNKYIF